MDNMTTTYLLGAGFARSANEQLPLSCDFFSRVRNERVGDTTRLKLNPSLKSLDQFVHEYFPGSPDLEDVMSFLSQNHFPPDFRQHWQHRSDLYTELLELVTSIYGNVMLLEPRKEAILREFARGLVQAGVNVMTFNYDCILDSFLLDTGKWFCESGYGIPLRHVSDCFHEMRMPSPASTMTLFRLHGGVNLGIPAMDVHDRQNAEVFFVNPDLKGAGCSITNAGVAIPHAKSLFHATGFHPFIVPPILDKSPTYETRLLRRLWYFAKEILGVSDRIIIVGYSFPPTDYMARFLFKEALGMHLGQVHEKREITVVNTDCSSDYRERVESIMTNCVVDFVEEDAIAYVGRTSKDLEFTGRNTSLTVYPSTFPPRMPYFQKEDYDDCGPNPAATPMRPRYVWFPRDKEK